MRTEARRNCHGIAAAALYTTTSTAVKAPWELLGCPKVELSYTCLHDQLLPWSVCGADTCLEGTRSAIGTGPHARWSGETGTLREGN